MKMSDVDITGMLKRESRAIQARDGIYETFYKSIAPQEASASSRNIFERILGETDAGGSGGGSLFTRQIVQRASALRPTPAGDFNKIFRRGLGERGTGWQMQRLRATDERGLPLPPRGGAEFVISDDLGRLPKEITADLSRSMSKVNPDAVVADPRLPSAYRVNTPPTRRAADVGVTSTAAPNRSFTGRKFSDQWHDSGKSAGLVTGDPDLVQGTIDSIDMHLKTNAKKLSTAETLRLQICDR